MTASGRLFQTWAAATGKARLPTVDSLMGDITRRLVLADRRARRRGRSLTPTCCAPLAPDGLGFIRVQHQPVRPKITDRSFRCFTLSLEPLSLRKPHSGTSSSISYSPVPLPITSSSDSPLCTSITPFLFHSRLKTYLFHKYYPP